MEATFYGVLGVAPDADDQTIVRAFRERVKACHPDVNDSPDAVQEFKRLQTARDVLTDQAERRKYDRLGHAAYLRQAEDCAGWSAPVTPSESEKREDRSRAVSVDGQSPSAAARAYASTTGSTAPSSGSAQGRSAGTDGTATAYYQPGRRTNPVSDGFVETLLGICRSLGVWVLIHAALALSAAGTAWFVLAWGGFSALSIAVAALLLVASLVVSALHVSVRAYP
jgi:curved DNA-binding protein CbpA